MHANCIALSWIRDGRIFIGRLRLDARGDMHILAVGVLIDAVLVRTLIVPAVVAVMGRWNWWMPQGFARLLRLGPSDTDGAPAQAEASA